MHRSVVGLTLDLLSELPPRTRECAFWELDPVRRADPQLTADDRARAKAAWVSATLLEWGCCGQVLLIEGTPVGYLLYAPAAFVPGAAGFPTAPAGADAVLLTTGEVFDGYRGNGYGRLLAQAVTKDVARRNVRAVEAFSARSVVPRDECLLPIRFLAGVGFRTVRSHPVTPRMRLDLRTTVRDEVGRAVQRVRHSLRPRTAVAPAPRSAHR